ncbi:MAG: hypothetical protein ABI910_13825, partial [Gemmatimonadota bacterium]
MGERPRDDEIARWRRVRALFDEAVQQPESARSAFLDVSCGGDRTLRGEIEALLQADATSHPVLDATPDTLADAIRSTTGVGGARDALRASRPLVSPGERFGSYEVERVLGHGGMATVYLAHDRKHARHVALRHHEGGELGQ